jgi:protein-S-isoprenylcysteine O-methyltransferase Ste14
MTILLSNASLLPAWALLAYCSVFFCLGFVWRSWATYRATGINPIVLPRDDSAQGYIGRAFKLTIIALFAQVASSAAGATPYKLWATPAWLHTTVWLGLLVAMAIMLLAQWQMGNAWRIGIDPMHCTSLVAHGLFRYSRNPIFAAMRLAIFDILWLQPSAWMLAIAIAGELLMQIQVRLEETHLQALHGDAYTRYCQQVRRWL